MNNELQAKNVKLLDDIARLVDDVVSLEELRALLNTGKKLIIKYGVDCTAPFLHLGHAVNLWVMRRFQEDGHKVIFLIGNFTSRIGDPTGRDKSRKILTDEEINVAAEEFVKQVSSVLITDDSDVFEIRRNAEWFENMPLKNFLGLCSSTTHAKLVSRDMFQKRIANGDEIHMNELLYPILQGYDSVMLDSDLTVVGSDQLFNEMMGRFFQERFNQNKQIVMTTKITKGLWGEEKQSKSIGNFVALSDTSKDKFGKIMQLSDDRIIEWMEVYTDIKLDEIEKISLALSEEQLNPRDAKMQLAHAIVEKYHGIDVANKEREDFIATFSKREFPDDAPIISLEGDEINIVDLIATCCESLSRTKIKGLIAQNAVTFNGKRINMLDANLKLEEENKLKVGKRLFFRIVKKG